VTTSAITVLLAPGIYRLTGLLQSSPSGGASVGIEITGGPTGGTGGGVASDRSALGVFGYTGDPLPSPPSMVAQACGATFSTPTGALEWFVTFRVLATQSRSPEELCL
jgi:hypothetical protein